MNVQSLFYLNLRIKIVTKHHLKFVDRNNLMSLKYVFTFDKLD